MASSALTLQRAFYIGNALSAILYGAQFCLCLQSIYYLKRRPGALTVFYVVFSLLLLFLDATWLGADILYGQYVWIERGQATPGGPATYFNENITWWVNTFGTAASVAADCMTQALLLFRCYVIVDSNLWITLLPGLLFLAASILGVLATVESALPGHFLLTGISAKFGIPCVIISVSFNVVTTAIIASRLMYAHYQLKPITPATHVERYAGASTIMIESALPLTVAGILFAVFYAKDSPATIAFSNIWGSMVGIAPQLIILRLSMGFTSTKNALGTGPSLHFASPQLTHPIDVELGDFEREEFHKNFGRSTSSL